MGYLGTEELKKILPTCIDKYDEERIDNVAYELALGDEVFLTNSSSGKKEILDNKNSQVKIMPGQFALLLTDEKVKIPNNRLAFISMKFSQKLKGLINVSGFHIDPGFEGKIIFSVYNAGPTTILLDKGKPYFMLWLAELVGETKTYDGKHNKQNSITGTIIGDLTGELASPNILLERIRANEITLKNFSWAAGLLIALGIGMTIKSCSDTSKYNDGYNDALKQKKATVYIDSILNHEKLDSVMYKKAEYIMNNIKSNDPKK